MFSIIEPSISDQENDKLMEIPTREEVEETLMKIKGNSSLGPDGFTVSFFKKCWEIVGTNVIEVVRRCFREERVIQE